MSEKIVFKLGGKVESKNVNTNVYMPEGFQLYFAGSYHKEFDPYLRKHGANRLGSQLTERPMVERWFNQKGTGHLFIDSGAYSAHSRGKEIDVDEYIDYLNKNDDKFHIFAQVDHIPGRLNQPKTPQELAEAPKISWDNYLYMRPKLKSPEKLIPVFHQGEDYKWLVNMLEWVDNKGQHIPYIGLSPSNDLTPKEKRKFLSKCYTIIKNSSNPQVKTHLFGMTSRYLLERFPCTSADSTSWLMTGANGSIMTAYGTVLLSSKSKANSAHYCHFPPKAQAALIQYVKKFGFTIEDLEEHYESRIKFNIEFLLNWARNYTYTPNTVHRIPLFWKDLFAE